MSATPMRIVRVLDEAFDIRLKPDEPSRLSLFGHGACVFTAFNGAVYAEVEGDVDWALFEHLEILAAMSRVRG